uniref:Uncharacterized protein n=1 Tax=Parascaris equorum TaxID=6256 RepID=A0A914S4Z4_PAREQ
MEISPSDIFVTSVAFTPEAIDEHLLPEILFPRKHIIKRLKQNMQQHRCCSDANDVPCNAPIPKEAAILRVLKRIWQDVSVEPHLVELSAVYSFMDMPLF